MAFPFLIAGGAAAMGGLSVLSASQSNKNVKKAVNQQYAAINENIRQDRLATNDAGYRLGQSSMSTIGNYLNSLGAKTGGSYRSVLAQMYQDSSMDQANLIEGQKNRERSAEMEKQAVQINGSNQMQNLVLQGLQGAVSGASFGASMQSALDGWQAASKAEAAARATQTIMESGTPEQKYAVMNGMPAAYVNSPGNKAYIDSAYKTYQQNMDLSRQSARASVDAQNAAARYWTQRLANLKYR